jgi:hypothetical protein
MRLLEIDWSIGMLEYWRVVAWYTCGLTSCTVRGVMRPNHITSSVFTNGSPQYPPGPYPNEKQNPNYVKKLEIASAVFDPKDFGVSDST